MIRRVCAPVRTVVPGVKWRGVVWGGSALRQCSVCSVCVTQWAWLVGCVSEIQENASVM